MNLEDLENGQYVICHCFLKNGWSSSFLLPTRLISEARPLAERYSEAKWPGQVKKLDFIRSNKSWAEGLLVSGKFEGYSEPSSELSSLLS